MRAGAGCVSFQPIDLTPLGAPQCIVQPSVDASLLLALDANGELVHQFTVPNISVLAGLRAWFQLANGQELHIVKVPQAPPRGLEAMQIYETHMALRVDSFRWALDHLRAPGYREDLADDHPQKMVVKTHPPTGYPQVYFLDPDRYLFEFNAAVLD